MSDVDACLLDDNIDISDNDNDEREEKKEANGEKEGEEERLLPRYTPHQVVGAEGHGGVQQQQPGGSSPPHPELASVAGYANATLVLTRRRTGEAGDEPHGWWSSREVTRPWRDRPDLARRPSVPPQQSERWERVKLVSTRTLIAFLNMAYSNYCLCVVFCSVLRLPCGVR